MHFDLIDIRLFLNIAEKQSLTQGAERSYMSAPAASVRIKNIEERLGTKLLYRTSQGVSPTAAGKAFVRHGRLLLRQLEDLHHDLRECASGMKGQLRIFASASAVTEFLPAIVSAYLATHRNVNVDLREGSTSDIVRAVVEGSADFGIVDGAVQAEGLEILPYRRERLVLATPRIHVLSQEQKVGFEETVAFDHVTLTESSPFRAFMTEAAKAMEMPITIRVQVGNFESLCRLVEMGVGVGVLPESAARRHAKTMSIRIVELTDDWAFWNLQACVRKLDTLPAFARDLIDLLLAEAPAAACA
jgi:DNA-binding transcriptional LysR family regulator